MTTSSRRRIAASVVALLIAQLAHAELPQRAPLQTLRPDSTDQVNDPQTAPEPPLFGSGLAVQGNIALVGMPGAFEGKGRIAAFVRNAAGQWIRRQTVTASDAAVGASFGQHIAIFNNRALVTSDSAVYVLQLTSGKWQEVSRLPFGRTVEVRDLDWHWNTVVVGARDSTGGAAYVFHMNATGTFTRIARLAPPDAVAADRFGEEVAVYSTSVAATAPGYNSEQGAAYVFACTETACSQRQKLLANDGEPGDKFGGAVDLANGVLVVGAPAADWISGDVEEPPSEQNYRASGAAYLFVRSGSTWTEQQKLRPSPQELNWYGNFGYELTVTGAHVVIAAPYQIERWEPGYVIDYRWSGGALVANKAMIHDAGHGNGLAVHNDTLFAGTPDYFSSWGAALVYNLAQ